MKGTLSTVCLLLSSLALYAQASLNATASLTDNAGNVAEGVLVEFSVEVAGAIYASAEFTNASGNASTTLELPSGTMQGILTASYLNCDSVEVFMTGTFSPNALGGLNDVFLTGLYCGGETGGCDMEFEGGLTAIGSWMFTVSGAPDDAVFDWSIDGVTFNNTSEPNFGWQFDGAGMWYVCVYVTSESCEPWTECYTVEQEDPDPTGGNCELSFEVVQAIDAAGNEIAGTLDLILPELAGQPAYFWDFGDEGTSTEATPSHTYSGNGPYLLCLTATWEEANLVCTATHCDSVSVDENGMINFVDGFSINVLINDGSSDVSESEFTSSLTIYPNPVRQGDRVQINGLQGAFAWDVFDPLGRVVSSQGFNAALQMNPLSTADWSLGWHVIRMTQGDGRYHTARVLVVK